jgi:FlaA1/EpsC-like NDP-sugar epimerase
VLISTDQAVRPANLMGASKRLAEQMVRLSGLSLRDAQNPNGEIAITCTGLRPGEKPYEQLLIGAESEPPQHPLIFCAHEQALPRMWRLRWSCCAAGR